MIDHPAVIREAAHIERRTARSIPIPDRYSLSALIREAVSSFYAMTPEQQEEHLRAQRESWVRGETAMAEWDRRRTGHATTCGMECRDFREKLVQAQRVIDHYRVALAQIQRTTRDSETAEYAIDMLQEAAEMLRGE
jgi:hypothetical protein